MNNCVKSNKEILSDIASIKRKVKKSKGTLDTLKKEIIEYIKSFSDPSVSSTIYNALNYVGIIDESFTPYNITNIITSRDAQRINMSEISSDRIVDTEAAKTRKAANLKFLDNAYGAATDVRKYVTQEIDRNLFNMCFINRDPEMGNLGNVTDLNNNIRRYLQQLLELVVLFLNDIVRKSPELQKSLDETLLNSLQNPQLYVKDGNLLKYTGILELLRSLINEYILNTSVDELRKLYRNKQNLKFKAFNAYVTLKHLDSYLISKLDSFIIDRPNEFTGTDKYSIATKTAKISTNWRTKDATVSEEADMVTRIAIETTPEYNWQNGTPIEGRYLTFSDFEHIICKIKDLSSRKDVQDLIFDKIFIDNNLYWWNNLSDETKNFLYGKSLARAINFIRLNPKEYISYIFELLLNSDFYDYASSTFMNKSNFTKEELRKLWSLKDIFHPLQGNSLCSLSKGSTSDIDFYEYITQMVDTIFSVGLLQYYRDDSGILKIRTLKDQSISNISRNIETAINTNSSADKVNDDFIKQFNIEFVENEVKFIIPDTTITVVFNTNSGSVTFKDSDNKIKNFEYLSTNEYICNYILNALRINLNNPDFYDALRDKYKSTSDMFGSLLSFASRVKALQYITKVKLSDISLELQREIINSLFAKNPPKYNYAMSELGKVHYNDIYNLTKIARAKADIYGITTATQVKDGSRNSLNLSSLSRLLGSFRSLWDILNKTDLSATKDSLILRNGILEGVFTVKEYHDFEQNKSCVDMSVNEMTTSALFDFVRGLTKSEDGNDIFGDGHVLFLPSVNSDKPTVGRILINLNETVNINGQEIPLKNLNSQQLEDLIAAEFGNIYNKIYKNIKSDWNILQREINAIFPDCPNLANDYINNFIEFNTWWRNNLLTREYGNSPVEFIKNFTLQFNKKNRLHPLELIDLMHYKNNGGSLSINKAFIALLARFCPDVLPDGFDLSLYTTNAEFWKLKKAEILKDLLRINFKLNIKDSSLPEFAQLAEAYPDWVNNSGNMILAKIKVDGEYKNISSALDLYKYFKSSDITGSIDSVKDSILLNPVLEQYNYLNYLFTEEFKLTTVGTFVAHPEKSKTKGLTKLEILKLEDAHILAQDKRNVSFTAAMYAFQLNTLNGCPEDYNIAVIEDLQDYKGTITGLINEITVFDGATFVNPAVVYLENNSLGGSHAGVTKKLFVHFYNPRTGSGGIIKTAGFGLTNDLISNSPLLKNMAYKMMHHVWLNEDGSFALVDITKDYKGLAINYGKQYFKQGKLAFEITKIESLGNNRYKRYLRELKPLDNGGFDGFYLTDGPNTTEDGYKYDTVEEFTLNNNYDLWQFFGGEHSLSNKDGLLVPSNSSVELLVLAINNVAGLDINGNAIFKTKPNGTMYTLREVKSLQQFWQPLKHADIHYIPTAGAVKQGAANINSVDKYTTKEDDLDIQRIKMLLSGILLDKEHKADQSDLSLMTLVVSACASKGYTFTAASLLYDALHKANLVATKDFYNALSNYIESDSIESLLEVVLKCIIQSLGQNTNSNNFASKIASDIIEQAKAGEKIKYSEVMLPLSDNTIYAKILSILSVYLTKSGIKLKIPGILAVLTPSHNLFKLYTNAKGETVKYESFDNPEEEIAEALEVSNSKPIFSTTTSIPIYVKSGEVVNDLNTFQLPDLNLVDIEDAVKPWKSDPNRSNNTRRIYLRGLLDRGYFEVVKDDEDGFYSIHFKPTDKNNPNAFSSIEKDILFKAAADVIPNGAFLSTYGTISRGGISGLNRFANLGFDKIGNRTVGLRYDNKHNNISNVKLGRHYIISRRVSIPLDFNKEYDGISLELAFRKVIWNRIYQDSPSNIRGQITKILNGNSNKSLRDIIDKLIGTVPEIALEEYRKDLIDMVNYPVNMEDSIDGVPELEYMLNVLYTMNPEKIQAILTTDRNEIFNKLKRYHLEGYTDQLILRAQSQIIEPLVQQESVFIGTPIDYLKLKEDKNVTRIVEDVTQGRNLDDYNVYFTTVDGQSYQLWDLDSAVALYKLTDIKNRYKKGLISENLRDLEETELFKKCFPNNTVNLSDFNNLLLKELLKDLYNLSPTQPDVLDLYIQLLESRTDDILEEDYEEVDAEWLAASVVYNGQKKTAQYGVIIDPSLKYNYSSWLQLNPKGIVAYRVNYNKFNTPEEAEAGRIGNPFSVSNRGELTVKNFFMWLVTGDNFGNEYATENYRQAIILKILNTPSDAPILYYTELNRPSHATVLGYLIRHKEILKAQRVLKPRDSFENFNGVSDSTGVLSSTKTILSNEELKYWNEHGVGERPRILTASERTDPAFHVKEILDIINGNKTVPQYGIVDGKRQIVGNISGKDFAGLYLITKHDGLPMLLLLLTKIPKLIHFSITGLGGTKYEPGVMKYNDLLDRIEDYIKQGLDPNCITIRIDPIIPGVTTAEDIENIVKRASLLGITRIRFSIMDAYPNTVLAMNGLGYDFEKYYGSRDGKINFTAKPEYFNGIVNLMLTLKDKYNVTLGTCAERIANMGVSKEGCLSVGMVNLLLGTNLEDKGTENNTLRALCSCYGGKVDSLAYDKTCASHCVYCYAKHENDKALEYYNEDGTLKDNIYTRTRQPITKPNDFVNHSGGAPGSDNYWGEVGKKYGIASKHYYAENEKTPYGNTPISKSELLEADPHLIKANKTLKRRFPTSNERVNNLLRRNWQQVKNADEVFAISTIKDGIVEGGTGWAVQMAIDEGKPVHVFDQNTRKWYKYNNNTWIETGTPTLTKNFAGIGTRNINDAGRRAIEEVYKQTLQKSENPSLKPINLSQKNYEYWKNILGEDPDVSGTSLIGRLLDVFYENKTFKTIEGAFLAAKLAFSTSYDRNDDNEEYYADEFELLIDELSIATESQAKELGKTVKGLNEKLWNKYSSDIKIALVKEFSNKGSIINIWSSEHENAHLSNFAIRPFNNLDISELDRTYLPHEWRNKNIRFQSVEQAFQFYKLASIWSYYMDRMLPKAETIVEPILLAMKEILITTKGSELRRIGRQKFSNLDPKVFSEWDKLSSKVMEVLIRASFLQNPQALQQLLATGNAILTHTQANDRWKKEFPRILMEVREEFRSTIPDSSKIKIAKRTWYTRYVGKARLLLGQTGKNLVNNDGNPLGINLIILPINGVMTVVTIDSSNFDKYEPIIRQLINNNRRVKINGNYVEVDKESIVTEGYGAIVPKVFASNFGLSEHDDLNSIINNKLYFFELYKKTYNDPRKTITDPTKFTVELKRSNGNHFYLITKRQALEANLTLVEDVPKIYIDNKIYRVDTDGNVMYEITEDFELYKNDLGIEVICTNDLNFYINSLPYDTINLSNYLVNTPSVKTLLFEGFKNSKKRKIKRYYRYIISSGDDINNILIANNIYNDPDLSDFILNRCLEKHTCFLQSLNILAARIPAQSMQSFMPMKIEAFDNPDLNNAYVSTLLLLLQGSDFDIDAVSIAMFDVDENGMLLMWSPYANLKNINLLRESFNLPIPTGKEISYVNNKGETIKFFKETSHLNEATKFFQKYLPLLDIQIKRVWNKEDKALSDLSDSEVTIDIRTDTVLQLKLLRDFLKDAESLQIPFKTLYEIFAKKLIDRGIIPNITGNHINSLFYKLKKLVDNHNLYFDDLSRRLIERAINNQTLYSMLTAISEAVNLTLSHISVDGTTGPLKKEAENSAESKDTNASVAGNFISAFKRIVDNQVGKDCIGVCAVGLKAFFALTQYNNQVLNNGISKELARLILGKNGILVGGNVYKTVANIRAADPNSINNTDVLAALLSADNDTDAAIILSALLSLATDNAKELTLSKLNATTGMINMYIYGLIIGIDFKKLANIMMSDTGATIALLLDSNVFTELFGFNRVTDQLFEYFEKGPKKQLYRYVRFKKDSSYVILSNEVKRLLKSLLSKKDQELINAGLPEKVKVDLYKLVAKLSKSSINFDYKINIFEKMREKYADNPNSEQFNQMIDIIEEYLINSRITENPEYYSIKALAKGSEELHLLGRILSINQGIKTKSPELINLVNNLTKCIYNKTGNANDIIDLAKFAMDENYREECIDKYEIIKHSFNILDVVAKVPHYLGYILNLAEVVKGAESSFKFRSIQNLADAYTKKLDFIETSRTYQTVAAGLLNYIGDWLIKLWMLSKDLSFYIPKGNRIYDKYGNSVISQETVLIKLGTDWGNATFRAWFENSVIPNLKAGKVLPNVVREDIANNAFIRDLGNDLRLNTVSKNPTNVNTLPINMLPRVDIEKVVFDNYKSEFNKLAGDSIQGGYAYIYEYDWHDDSGKTIVKRSDPYSIVNLFTYYAMIADNWKLGEQSLVSIFEDFQNYDELDDFHKFVSTLDKSGISLKETDVRFDDVLPYIIGVGNPFKSYLAYIRFRNPSNLKYYTMYKLTNEEIAELLSMGAGYNIFGNYAYLSLIRDTNMFPTGSIESTKRSETKVLEIDGVKYEYSVDYDLDSKRLTYFDIVINDRAYKIDDLEDTAKRLVKTNGLLKPDYLTIEFLIKNIVNPC